MFHPRGALQRNGVMGLLVLVTAACGVPEDLAETDLAQTQQAIIGGTVTAAEPAVVSIAAHAAGSFSTWYQCTGVVISPHVVITAAHCISPAALAKLSYLNDGYVIDVRTGTTPFSGGNSQVYEVAETQIDPAFNLGDFPAGHDIGVVILRNAIPVTPLPVNRAPLTSDLVGRVARQLGYGSANGASGAGIGTKRETQTVLTRYNAVQELFADPNHSQCHGDSGGPSLMVINGVEKVMGLSSWGATNARGEAICANGSWDTRTDVVASFFDPYVRRFDPNFPIDDADAYSIDQNLDTNSGVFGADGRSGTGSKESAGCAAVPGQLLWGMFLLPLLLRRRKA
ncbi:MAG: S1 family peptidase [Myxococcaceae bacterium]